MLTFHDDGTWTCGKCTRNSDWDDPELCAWCGRRLATTCIGGGQKICDYCLIRDTLGEVRWAEVAAVLKELEVAIGAPVGIDVAVTEWRARRAQVATLSLPDLGEITNGAG